jgi:hypothetical protein
MQENKVLLVMTTYLNGQFSFVRLHQQINQTYPCTLFILSPAPALLSTVFPTEAAAGIVVLIKERF